MSHLPPSFQGALNFVLYKFSHLLPKEQQTMYELSTMFFQFQQHSQNDNVSTYKVNYTR